MAGLKDGFIKMTNDIMELTSALQSEQEIKKLIKKVDQLQAMLEDMQEMVEVKS
jgi:hypothetical protein